MLQRARDWWEAQSRNNQIIFGASAFGVLVALIGFVMWAGQPEYSLLFADLSPQDASVVVDKLREQNVPYHVTNGSKNIEVPAQKRDELRMQLLGQNVIKPGNASIGNGILDSVGPMTTDRMEGQKLTQAREGEVSKTIMAMEQVASATVHYGEADTSMFVSGTKTARAAVIVGLKPGMSLTKENVKAIVRLTQMPVAGLKDTDITVTDTTGRVLFDGPSGGENNIGDIFEKNRAFANERKAELQSVMDRAVGKGNAIVLVNTEMNFDTETTKRIVPEVGTPLLKTTEIEQFQGEGSLNRAPVGTTANANGTANPAGAAAGGPGTPGYVQSKSADGNYTHESNTTQFSNGQTETVTNKAPMRLEKFTVSAMIDSTVKLDGKPVDVATIKQILETNIAATGNEAARAVSVVLFPFNHTEEMADAKASAAAAAADRMQKTLAIAVPLVLMVVCFLLLARALKKPGMLLSSGGEQLALAGAGMGGMGLLESGTGYSSFNAPEGTMITLPDGTTGSAADYVVSPDGTLMRRALDDEGDPIGLLIGETAPKTYDVINQQFDGVFGKHSSHGTQQTRNGWSVDQNVGQ